MKKKCMLAVFVMMMATAAVAEAGEEETGKPESQAVAGAQSDEDYQSTCEAIADVLAEECDSALTDPFEEFGESLKENGFLFKKNWGEYIEDVVIDSGKDDPDDGYDFYIDKMDAEMVSGQDYGISIYATDSLKREDDSPMIREINISVAGKLKEEEIADMPFAGILAASREDLGITQELWDWGAEGAQDWGDYYLTTETNVWNEARFYLNYRDNEENVDKTWSIYFNEAGLFEKMNVNYRFINNI